MYFGGLGYNTGGTTALIIQGRIMRSLFALLTLGILCSCLPQMTSGNGERDTTRQKLGDPLRYQFSEEAMSAKSNLTYLGHIGDFRAVLTAAKEYVEYYGSDENIHDILNETQMWIDRIESGIATSDIVVDQRLTLEYDEVDRIKRYYHSFIRIPTSRIFLYTPSMELIIVQLNPPSKKTENSENLKFYRPRLLMCVKERGSNRIYADRFTVVADDHRYHSDTIAFERFDKKSYWFSIFNNIDFYESGVKIVGVREIEILNAVVKSQKAILRIRGEQGHRDHIITEADKLILGDMLTAYRVLGGSIN